MEHLKTAMMKKIYAILFVAIFGISAHSCSADWMDLTPSDAASESEAVGTYADARIVLAGVYDAIQGNSSNYDYYGARMIYYGDVRGDDMQAAEAGKRTAACYEMNYTLSSAPAIWRSPYIVLRRANSLLAAVEKGTVGDATAEQLNPLKGEALVARALAHFDLLRVHALPYDAATTAANHGIPLVLSPLSGNATPGRNTVGEVYAQVEKDLKDAISLLPDARSYGYFNSWTAKALLARMYLYKGTADDNRNAFAAAEDIIDNSPYTLWTSGEYVAAWSKANTSEVIFEAVTAGSDDWVDREGIGYLLSEDGYADAIATKAFVDFAETAYAGDVRLGIMKEATATGDGKFIGRKAYVNKYPGREGEQDFRVNNVPLFRLSEMYLIAAEAAAKTGNQSAAAKYLNAIVARGNPSAAAVTAADATVERILSERRMEFIGEGHRFFDLIRNDKRIIRYTSEADRGWHVPLSPESQQFDRNYFRAILPIPQSEIDANPVIKEQQNPRY
jgi:hypothetical protein